MPATISTTTMTFANADAFLLLLLLVPLAAVKIAGDAMARRRLRRIAGPRLLTRLRRGGWRGREVLTFVFEALALGFFVTALARPQWGFTEREVQGEGRSIIIALDTSRSMLATDLKPNRMTRAKLAAQDLVAALPGDKIGLIAFAGRSFLQAPLTTDHEALIEALQQFDTELIPRGGTNLSEPIELAGEIFDKAGTASHALIMFSDGDELEGNSIEVARKAKERNIMIVAVGVGTHEGSLLPDDNPRNRGGFLKDANGRPVRSKLEDRVLEGLARETGGLYLNLSSTSVLKERIEVILNKLDRSRTAAQKDKRQPVERYQWALIPGMLCLLMAFSIRLGRRLRATPGLPPLPAGVTALFVLLTSAATPALGGVVIPTKELRGPSPWQLYAKGDFAAATEEFEAALARQPRREKLARLEFGRGASLYRENEHEAAIEAFGRALTSPERSLQAEAAYNLGNALAGKAKSLPKGKGRVSSMIALITEAIAHYDETLTVEPTHENAKTNRDRLTKFLEQLKEYREQLRQKARDKKKQKGDKGEEEKQDQQGQQGQQNQDGQQGDQGKPGAGQQGEEEDSEDPGDEEGDQGAGPQEGEGSQGEKPDGAKGDGPKEGPGKGPTDREQAGPEGNEKERSGEQKDGGKVEAKSGEGQGEGDQPQKPGEKPGAKGDQKRDQKTGFSRSEARSLLRALSDEDYVRPLTDKAAPEGTYKNW